MPGAGDGGALFDLVGGEVGGGDEAAAGLHVSGEGGGDGAAVEAFRVGGDLLEGVGEEGLLEAVAGGEEVAVALVEVGGVGGEFEDGVGEVLCFAGGEDEALAGEADGGGEVSREGEAAEVGLRVDEAGDGAGNAGGAIADGRGVGDDVAGGVEVHVAGGGCGGFFAVVEEVGVEGTAAAAVACVDAEEHEATAAEVASLRVSDGEGEGGGDGGVYGVAALAENGEAGVGGVVLDGDDHGVLGLDGEVGGIVVGRSLGVQERSDGEEEWRGDAGEDGQGGLLGSGG